MFISKISAPPVLHETRDALRCFFRGVYVGSIQGASTQSSARVLS
jgi:hypothetical protein